MNHLEGQRGPLLYTHESYAYNKFQQVISTIALLCLGYYALSSLDAWPSTTKRTLYELTIRFTPSRFVYFLQYAMMRAGRLSEQDSLFRRENFGDFRAKEEAIQRIVGNTPIPNVLQRARTLSGYDKLIPLTRELGPPGLGNWDNSCYQNSILQGLASLPAFQHYVHRSLLLCEKANVLSSTTEALAVFLDQLSDASCHKQTIWTPKVLKSMDSWQQQDAQEYFSRVLEAIEKEAVQYAKVVGRSANAGLACLRPTSPTSEAEKEKLAKKLLQTLISNPMDGMFAQSLSCQTCGFSEGVSMNLFNCLTLNLGLGGQRSVENLLDEYTDPELVDGVECINCTRMANKESSRDGEESTGESDDDDEDKKKSTKKELRVKAKQITFGRLPKNLVIHINRSIWDDYGNQVKNPSFVRFPSRLDFLGEWCAPLEAGPDTVQAVYELKCIVTHSGRHDNGHYVAYGQRGKGWYCFNDEIVTQFSEEEVLTRGNVFMLFYEAVDMTELMMSQNDELDQPEAQIVEESTTPTSSSAASEVFEEPASTPLQVPVPVMRTASGRFSSGESESPLGLPFVPAV